MRIVRARERIWRRARTLATKAIKAATESQRIATTNVDWALGKLADLSRAEIKDKDAEFPGLVRACPSRATQTAGGEAMR